LGRIYHPAKDSKLLAISDSYERIFSRHGSANDFGDFGKTAYKFSMTTSSSFNVDKLSND
jgi:hypothetical protein